MSKSVGNGTENVLGQWERNKEDAKALKEMEGFMLKLTKVPMKVKGKSKGKGGKKI